ncbi:MAG: hypothetical protein EBU90_11745 [Proteobacteria bacterium]|nr:hypothetical protein [Pseudomonadota bacterium]NBP14510.1 hypothetical protein [bacterium]
MADFYKQIQDNDLFKILLVVAGIYLFLNYTKKENLENLQSLPMTLADDTTPASAIAQPHSQEMTSAPAGEITMGKPQLQSEDLLPKYDEANAFAKENPVSKLLKEQNFLISGYHVGINTVVQSNKIPYHDLRSAPPIPKENVGPWAQSSYETPMGSMRRQLEIS